jgi:NADP-dependent 3-hydroxy acid dehydrogenase YdfG
MLDAEYIKTLVKKAAEFGNGKIHIIVNNAGSANLNHLSKAYIAHCLADTLGMV